MSVHQQIESLIRGRAGSQQQYEEDLRCATSSLSLGKLVPLSESGASLSRLLRHTSNGAPFIIMSAFRSGLSVTANNKRNGEMLLALQAVKLGGILLQGHWIEELPDKTKVPVSEVSFFFPWTDQSTLPDGDAMRAYCAKLAHKYEQEGIIYGDGTDVYYVDTTRVGADLSKIGTQMTVGKETVEKAIAAGTGHSRIHKYDFVFEGYRVPKSMVGAVMMNHQGVFKV